MSLTNSILWSDFCDFTVTVQIPIQYTTFIHVSLGSSLAMTFSQIFLFWWFWWLWFFRITIKVYLTFSSMIKMTVVFWFWEEDNRDKLPFSWLYSKATCSQDDLVVFVTFLRWLYLCTTLCTAHSLWKNITAHI